MDHEKLAKMQAAGRTGMPSYQIHNSNAIHEANFQ